MERFPNKRIGIDGICLDKCIYPSGRCGPIQKSKSRAKPTPEHRDEEKEDSILMLRHLAAVGAAAPSADRDHDRHYDAAKTHHAAPSSKKLASLEVEIPAGGSKTLRCIDKDEVVRLMSRVPKELVRTF